MHHIKTYTISLIPEGDSIRAVCIGLDSCEVRAPTRRQALDAIEDKIKARIAEATVHRRPLPVDRSSTKFIWINVEEFLV